MNFIDADMLRRRKASARFAWGAGIVALTLYIVGFFIQR